MQNILTEYQECIAFVEWLTMKGLLFSHIAQETFTKSWGVKMKNQRMGVRRGVPDYIIVIPKGRLVAPCLVFVEMKRQKGGVISPEQKEWMAALNSVANVEARVCKGAEEAINFINSLL